jgi:iron complex outermembrane receptor protein
MKKLLFALIFIFLAVLVNSQSLLVSGIVTDAKTKETIPGAVITIDSLTVVTDIDGKFEIEVSGAGLILVCNAAGYDEYSIQINATNFPEGKSLEIFMNVIDNELTTVVVSSGRFEQKLEEVPASVEVIKPYLIEQRASNNLEGALDMVSGLNLIDGQPSIRGGGGFAYGAGSRVMVLVDDMPMLAADAGDARWDFFGIENVAQVEVMKGASSALYGSSALNGVIHLRSKEAGNVPETRFQVLHGFYGDPIRSDSTGNRRDSTGALDKSMKWWGDQQPVFTAVSFNHLRKLGADMDLNLGGQLFSDQGYRMGENEQRGRLNGSFKWRVKKVKGLVAGVGANAVWRNGGNFLIWENADSGALRPSGGLDTATTSISFFKTKQFSVDPYIKYASGRHRHALRTRYYLTSNDNIGNQSSDAALFFAEYQYQFNLTEFQKLTGGVSVIKNVVNADLYGDHNSLNPSLYLQYDGTFFKKLTVSGGFRLERFTMNDTLYVNSIVFGKDTLQSEIRPVGRLGASYQIHNFTWVRASFGQGFRFPSVAERYVNTIIGALRLFPNPVLQPEMGWNAELGVRQAFKMGSVTGLLDIAGFYSRYKDMIEFNFGLHGPVSLPPFKRLGFKALNLEDALIRGVEGTITMAAKFKKVDVKVIAGYTFMDPVIQSNDSLYLLTRSDTTSRMLKYRFRHLVKADILLEWKHWTLGYSFRYFSFMENVDAILEQDLIVPGSKEYRRQNSTGAPVSDFRLGYTFAGKNNISLVINNAFNREYMTRPADIRPPRTIALQYILRF